MRNIDTDSLTWKTTAAAIEHRIKEIRSYLERSTTDWEQTVGYRAELKGLRNILGLPERIENGTEPSLRSNRRTRNS